MDLAMVADPAPTPHDTASTDFSQPPLVTVIEDESIVLAGYQMLFESWGYRVVAVSSAEEAIDSLGRAHCCPDIILADYRLKDNQTGVQAIRSLQELYGHDIPGILITGDSYAERLRDAASSGLPILHKPVKSLQLQSLVCRYLNRK